MCDSQLFQMLIVFIIIHSDRGNSCFALQAFKEAETPETEGILALKSPVISNTKELCCN